MEDQGAPKKSPTALIIIVLLLVLGGGFMLFKNMNGTNITPSPAPNQEATQGNETPVPIEGQQPFTPITSTKTFVVTAKNYSFDQKTLEVNKGDTVKILFKNSGGEHDLVFDDFDTRTQILDEGEEEEITFVADKSGSFEFYCSVGQHRKMGMVGVLVVK